MNKACTPSSGSDQALFATRLALPDRRQGKVRDVYALPDHQPPAIALIATDRLSAFDVVMPTPIPGKGMLLTAIAAFWLRRVEALGLSRTHVLSTDADALPASAFDAPDATPREALYGRVTIGRACAVIPIECVVRGYLEGSGWREYQQAGTVCGIALPPGLRQCDRLPEPIFTPATKAEGGAHDENIPFDDAARRVGRELMETLRERAIAIYRHAADYALRCGLILADTKFEFGRPTDALGRPDPGAEPMLIDEALTPDSSRYWDAAEYEPGRAQRSFDKQFVREYLEALVARGAWDKAPPGPELPESVVEGTLDRYREAAERLGAPLLPRAPLPS